jgi:tRNA threonylcarbamoyladenosine biosynthesis protein TsaB
MCNSLAHRANRIRPRTPARICAKILCVFILALDTCDARGGVALLRDDLLLQTEAHTVPEDYSSWLLPAITRVLTSAALTLSEIDLCAVAAGPGSFTGVRMGLTTVKAWSEVYGRPIAAVSRLEAVAADSTGSAPYVAAFIDARRSQVFAALYRRQATSLERLEDEMVIAPCKFLDWCASKVGSERIDWVSTDPASLTQTPEWASRLGEAETVQGISSLLAPRIGQIGYRLAQQGRLTDALSLDANYIRRSDAELSWKVPSHHGR